MLVAQIEPITSFYSRIQVPGDKSLSHRALMFAAMAQGRSQITGLLNAADVRSTWSCLQQLGIPIEQDDEGTVIVQGQGLHGFQAPTDALDCGNSGTTLRLMMGMLAGQNFSSRLVGDASLSGRPMGRVAEPLRQMGAQIQLTNERFAPVQIRPASLQGLSYQLPVASAQLKSALLLAGLWASGPVTLTGAIGSRDHTERLLPHFGVQLEQSAGQIRIQPGQQPQAARFQVPGDPSTAAFWLAAAAMIPGSEIELPGVSLNPTRLGFVRVLERMGAQISLEPEHSGPEPVGCIRLKGTELQGTDVLPQEIPDLVDEVPLIAVLATQAQGRTSVRGAQELRIKESDRLQAIALNLKRMGGQLELFEDGFILEGPQALQGAEIEPFHDHRIAMAFAIAALKAKGPTTILQPECVGISYPEFFSILKTLS